MLNRKSILMAIIIMLLTSPVMAGSSDKTEDKEPWARAGLYFGAMTTDINSNVGLGFGGSGLDAKVALEDILELDSNMTVFRVDGFWRISRRNRLDFLYYDLSRSSDAFLGVEIGGYPIGTEVSTRFDMEIFKAAYTFSIFNDDRIDIGVGGGLHVLEIYYKMDSPDSGNLDTASITAPLPVLSFRAEFALTKKLFFRQSLDMFFIEFDQYTGQLNDLNIALEYNFWKHAGVGIGYDIVYADIKADNERFLNEIEIAYSGIFLFGKIYF